jgi:hypothetical protein
MNLKAIIVTALISTTIGATGAGIASAQMDRGQYGSNQNMRVIDGRLAGIIGQLNHDDRDYGGHRQAAVNDLQSARNQIVAAEQFARQHGY